MSRSKLLKILTTVFCVGAILFLFSILIPVIFGLQDILESEIFVGILIGILIVTASSAIARRYVYHNL